MFFFDLGGLEPLCREVCRAFVSQTSRPGPGGGLRPYGMNVGANTMTLAAQKIDMTIIPVGHCTFPGKHNNQVSSNRDCG